MQKLESRITNGVIWKEMLKFFTPIMLGTLLQQVYNMADTVILSRYVGKLALASVGGSDVAIIWLLVNAFVALCSGASVIVSQHYGAGDVERLEKSVHSAIWMAIIGGAIVTLLGVFGGPYLLVWLGTKPELMQYSRDYLTYYFLGMIPALLFNMGSGILRAIGDSKKPLYFLLVSTIANIGLDIVFVKYFQMEVKGAAIATTISQVISAVLVLAELMRTKKAYKVSLSKLKIDKVEMVAMLKIGIPAAFQSMSYNVCNVLIQSAINMLSTDTVAAWSVFWKLDGIYWPISNAIGIAIMTFVGQNYGAAKKKRIRETLKTGILMHLSCSILFFLVLDIGASVWMGAITSEPEVIRIGVEIIRIMGPAYTVFSLAESLSSAMRGVGKAIEATTITLICICVVRIIFLYTVVFNHPSNLTIALCYPISWSCSSIGFFLYYQFSRWLPKLNIPEE